jgi:hypothetical protein
MLDKEQLLEVGPMEMDCDEYKSIEISAIEVDLLLPEAKERIKEKAMLDDKYKELCKQITNGGNIDTNFSLSEDQLCRKNRIYVHEALRQRIIQWVHDSNLAGHF